ncbi:hypothetical protein [Amorphus sp. MBR-141]
MTGPTKPSGDRGAAAAELMSQCAELRARARALGFDLLAYLLDVAHEEAAARVSEMADRTSNAKHHS